MNWQQTFVFFTCADKLMMQITEVCSQLTVHDSQLRLGLLRFLCGCAFNGSFEPAPGLPGA